MGCSHGLGWYFTAAQVDVYVFGPCHSILFLQLEVGYGCRPSPQNYNLQHANTFEAFLQRNSQFRLLDQNVDLICASIMEANKQPTIPWARRTGSVGIIPTLACSLNLVANTPFVKKRGTGIESFWVNTGTAENNLSPSSRRHLSK